MKPEFSAYLTAIGMTEILIHRVSEIYDFYLSFLGEHMEEIFVSDFVTQDGAREYSSLWLFTKRYVMEAKTFVHEDNFDLTPLVVSYFNIVKQDFDFDKANTKSRLTLQLNFQSGVTGALKATGENCEKLRDIVKILIFPNVK